MPLETATYIQDLVESNPARNDLTATTDDHLRLIKKVLKTSFPNLDGPLLISSTNLTYGGSTELNGDVTVNNALDVTGKTTIDDDLDVTGNLNVTGSVSSNSNPVVTNAELVGAIQDFAMSTPPPKWLRCDGSAVSRTTYSALYNRIGDLWGAGDGSTTFNLPDFETDNRFRRTADQSLLLVGDTQDSQNKNHTHDYSGTVTANGGHSHSVSGTVDSGGVHTHGVSGTTASNGSHSHSVSGSTNTTGSHSHSYSAWRAGPYNPDVIAENDGTFVKYVSENTSSAGNHSHSVTGTTNTTGSHTHAFSTTSDSEGAHTHTFSTTSDTQADHDHNYSGTTTDNGGAEARPKAVAVLTCIYAGV